MGLVLPLRNAMELLVRLPAELQRTVLAQFDFNSIKVAAQMLPDFRTILQPWISNHFWYEVYIHSLQGEFDDYDATVNYGRLLWQINRWQLFLENANDQGRLEFLLCSQLTTPMMLKAFRPSFSSDIDAMCARFCGERVLGPISIYEYYHGLIWRVALLLEADYPLCWLCRRLLNDHCAPNVYDYLKDNWLRYLCKQRHGQRRFLTTLREEAVRNPSAPNTSVVLSAVDELLANDN